MLEKQIEKRAKRPVCILFDFYFNTIHKLFKTCFRTEYTWYFLLPFCILKYCLKQATGSMFVLRE